MRLTTSIRTRIIKTLLAHKFSAEEKALVERGFDLGDKFYRAMISEENEKLADKLNEAIPGFCAYRKTVYINVSDHSESLDIARARPWPNNGSTMKFDSEHPLSAEFASYELAKADLSVRRRNAENIATRTVNSVTTWNALRKAWPEIVPLVEHIFGEKPAQNLPTLPKDELNAMFDLPVEMKEAA